MEVARRFNRYMVECEFYPAFVGYNWLRVLIDTWWNVNVLILGESGSGKSFNRYMVECESSCLALQDATTRMF